MDMLQHAPWVGHDYHQGINGRKIAIVGNSHWHGPGEVDHQCVTIDVLTKVVSGEYGDIAFFRQIRDYFGFTEASEFWQRAAFFNYAPRTIGPAEQKYGHIPFEQLEEARQRFRAILAELQPTDVFVFTKKIVWALPSIEFENHDYALSSARTGCLSDGVSDVRIHLLRHPQGAKKQLMIDTVAEQIGSTQAD